MALELDLLLLTLSFYSDPVFHHREELIEVQVLLFRRATRAERLSLCVTRAHSLRISSAYRYAIHAFTCLLRYYQLISKAVSLYRFVVILRFGHNVS